MTRPRSSAETSPLRPEEVVALARKAGRIAFDAEFMSEGRYWTKLCLVALAAERDGNAAVAIIDTLEEHDPSAVCELLEDPAVEVITHAGEQDIALVRRIWRTSVTSVFDTQIAAAFVDTTLNAGYGKLLRNWLGVSLPKSESYTRWDRRPLSAEQVSYARQDVEHLPALAARLSEELSAVRRLEWAREESRRLEDASDERDPERSFRRLPKVNELSAANRAVAYQLVLWRDEAARRRDRPPQSLLSDAALMQMARRRPASPAALTDIRGLSQTASRRDGQAMLAAIRAGERSPPLPPDPVVRIPDEAEPLAAIGTALVSARAHEVGIAPQLIANRAEITSLAAARLRGESEPHLPVLSGWRRELIGRDLVELFAGRRSLSLTPDARVKISRAEGET